VRLFRNRIALTLAALAVALGMLSPVAMLAAPASGLAVICTAEGAKTIPDPLDGAPAGHGAAKHCPLCVVGASPALAAAPVVPLYVALAAAAIPDGGLLVSPVVRESPARPRAPPLSV